ncbi:hypothetical protein EW146_g2548 [Bondarzewia mesenterica]|uniref:Uncharacterized protein n=1 Tax=Bondarzewia mesenterica TaxID=1095465 RepID=A0A4S4M2N0_9AGAM|nr:hypothetical protein EW146_g2548 [Bondarzewia mesenterica]
MTLPPIPISTRPPHIPTAQPVSSSSVPHPVHPQRQSPSSINSVSTIRTGNPSLHHHVQYTVSRHRSTRPKLSHPIAMSHRAGLGLVTFPTLS